MSQTLRTYFTKESLEEDVRRIIKETIQKDNNMNSETIPLDKYLDARFASIEGKIDGHIAAIDQRFAHIEEDMKEIRTDVRDIRSDIKGLRSWYIGTSLVIIGILVGLITYHAQVMQSQMSVFADYVKAVTQPQK